MATEAQILEAAVCMTGKLPDIEENFPDEVLQCAHDKYQGRIGLQELWRRCARLNGHTDYGPIGPSTQRAALAAFGFSSVILPGILSNVANKFLKAGFNAIEAEWRKFAAIRPVSDFKLTTGYRLTASGDYEKVGPTGELKHATLGEEQFTNKADTYGAMLTITRHDIINDDLGALTAAPKKLGRAAGTRFNEEFYKTFLDNATFFTAPRGNYSDAAGTAFSADSLQIADSMFRAMLDADGKPTGLLPKILLVPAALRVSALRLMGSTDLGDDGSKGTANPWADAFKVASSVYLSSGGIPGSFSTAWYLLADPEDLPVVEVVFLSGREEPFIEHADAPFEVLGVSMRSYHDWGVSLHEHRGGVKLAGTPVSEG